METWNLRNPASMSINQWLLACYRPGYYRICNQVGTLIHLLLSMCICVYNCFTISRETVCVRYFESTPTKGPNEQWLFWIQAFFRRILATFCTDKKYFLFEVLVVRFLFCEHEQLFHNYERLFSYVKLCHWRSYKQFSHNNRGKWGEGPTTLIDPGYGHRRICVSFVRLLIIPETVKFPHICDSNIQMVTVMYSEGFLLMYATFVWLLKPNGMKDYEREWKNTIWERFC